MSKKIYSWEFNDKKNRSSMWYIIAISIVIGSSLWGFLTSQYGFSFIVLLIGGLYYFNENNSIDIVNIQLSDIGININSIFYDYSSIDSFLIVYEGENPFLLRLNLKKKGLKYIDINITRENLKYIKVILPEYINEKEKIETTFTEKMINLLKL